MKVLLTGGLGVNGAWVTRAFVDRGLRPVVVDTRRDFSLLGDEYAERIDLETADITDLPSMCDVLQRHAVDRVVHMAAVILTAPEQLLQTFRVNALGTVNILEAAARSGVSRVVFTSSRAAYGSISGDSAHPGYAPITEDYPARPVMAYDVCKLASEGMGENYARLRGLPFVALRFAAIFGPGKARAHGAFGIHSRIIEDALAGKGVLIPRGGDQRDDVIYVKDVAQAICLATLAESVPQTLYNISRGVGTTLHQFADAVRTVVPDARIEIGPGTDYLGLGMNYFGIMDNRRAQQDLGFAPRYDLHTGVADYVNELRRLRRHPPGAEPH